MSQCKWNVQYLIVGECLGRRIYRNSLQKHCSIVKDSILSLVICCKRWGVSFIKYQVINCLSHCWNYYVFCWSYTVRVENIWYLDNQLTRLNIWLVELNQKTSYCLAVRIVVLCIVHFNYCLFCYQIYILSSTIYWCRVIKSRLKCFWHSNVNCLKHFWLRACESSWRVKCYI